MLVGNKVSHSAVTEAYCLISSYIREEGKIGTTYDKEDLLEFVHFLADILKHPENFGGIGVIETPVRKEKTIPEHDGTGLA